MESEGSFMFKSIGLVFILILSGCAAAEIVKTTETPKRGGVIRYNNGNFVREKSRLIAITKIDEYCNGPFTIEKEEFNPDVFSVAVGGSHYTNDKDNFMFIHFFCAN